jgi:hypothetical protein
MTFTPGSSEEVERAVTRLVDDSLGKRERSALEGWAADHPGVTREVATQRSVAFALRAGGPPAPESLIATVEARLPSGRGSRRPGAARTRITGRTTAAAALAAVALAAATVANSLSGNTTRAGPSIALAAKLAFAPATEPAPASTSATLLGVTYGGITFPNYALRFGAAPTGQRVDRLGGRGALTVFYRLRGGPRLSYTIYSGHPVPLPRTASEIVFHGVHLHVISASEHLMVVTLVRRGHTCVLAARASAAALIALAEAPLQTSAA